MKECPARDVLEQLATNRLPKGERLAVHDHLAGCDRCRRALLELGPEGALTATKMTPIDPVMPIAVTDKSLSPQIEKERSSSPTLSLGKFEFLAPATTPGDLGRLGTYRVIRVLGEGGMGIVFKGVDPLLERPVALKVMKPESAADENSRKRFLREGKLAASVRHDHVVAIYQVDDTQGVPYLAMELLEGEPLDRRLKRDGRQPVAEVLRIGREVAEGLAAAHAKGLVHRDIKPANIWMEKVPGRLDRAKILDFGLARGVGDKETHLTRTGVIMGTPDYMAPEQARGTDLDARCDLFSLGCVLYHAATGQKPFLGEDVMATLLALATEDPLPMRQLNPLIPREVEDRIRALMAKKPNDRPKDARAVVDEFSYLEMNLTVLNVPRPTPVVSPPRPVVPGSPRGPVRKVPRRTVNPNASIDELLRAPTSARPGTPTSPPPPARPAKAPASGHSSDTVPLDANDLSPWSGAVAPIAPAAPPSVKKPAPESDATAPLAQPVPAKPVPSIPVPASIDPNIPLTGTCPKCGSSRYGKSSLGWCQVCGFSVAGPKAGEDIASIQERYRTDKSLTWIWTVLIGSIAIIAATIIASRYVPRGSTQWTTWVWMQFSSGAGSFLCGLVWAYILVWQYHDDSQTFLPMFATPLRFAHAVLKQSFRTKNAVCLSVWGLAATLGILYVVGDPSFWWMKGDMKMQLQVIKLGMTGTSEHKLTKLKCQVIGYREENGVLMAVLLAETDNGTRRYVGTASRVSETATGGAFTATLPSHRRSLPVVAVPGEAAMWVDPVLNCIVEFDKRDADGRLVDPIVVAWEKR
jgi:serine/threonine protein kinase